MKRATLTTIEFCLWILLLSPVYWFLCLMVSWSGPEDDIAIIYLLAFPILLHGFVIARYGLKQATKSALIFFSLIATLCIARHFEIAGRSGYNSWLANRSLVSLAWSIPWFLGSLSFTLLRKTVSSTIEDTEQSKRRIQTVKEYLEEG